MKTVGVIGFFIIGIIFMGTFSVEESTPTASKSIQVKNVNPILPFGTVLTQRGKMSRWNEKTLADAFQKAREAGIGIAIWTYDWGTAEKKIGKYDWSFLDYVTERTEQNGFKFSLSLEVVHITQKANYPKGIKFTRFNEPFFVDNFKIFIGKLVKRYKGKINYLWIGQEVELYLHNHPEQKQPFLEFFKEVKKEIKSIAPEITVGIVGSYHLAREVNETKLLQEFARVSDVLALTLYMEADVDDPEISDTKNYFDGLINLISEKKIAIHETAWSSGGKKGSEQKQTQFVMELAKAINKHKAHFEFISWYMLHDFSDADSKIAASAYGMQTDKNFVTWQGSLGLLKNDGTEKPAWRIWKEQMTRSK